MKRTLFSLLLGGLAATATIAVSAQDPAGIASAPAARSGVTAEQRAALTEKLTRIDTIMRAAEADGVNSMTAEKRQWMREALYSMPLAQIKAIRPTGNVDATTQAIARAQVQAKALGAASTDLVFFPFAPCRYIDTRNVGGKITGARGFDFANSGNVYGGAAGCNLTTLSGAGENQIAAVSLNMTIVDTSTAAAPGFATARPAGATASTALVNWTVSSAGFQLGNAAVITNDQTGAANELEIFTSGAVHAIVDVAGVFAAPTATLPDCFLDNTSTETPANGVAWNFNSVACPATHRAVSSGSYAFATDAYVHHQLDSNQTPPDKAFCYGRNVSGASTTVRCTVLCCRIPGR